LRGMSCEGWLRTVSPVVKGPCILKSVFVNPYVLLMLEPIERFWRRNLLELGESLLVSSLTDNLDNIWTDLGTSLLSTLSEEVVF
jgi:hypothetical protein